MDITNNNALAKNPIEHSGNRNNSVQSKGRLTGLCLLLTFAAPMIIAYWIYHTGVGIPEATVNKGTLLFPATDISTLVAADNTDHQKTILDSEHKRWRMIIPIENQCDESCAENIYTTRQVYKRLPKESHRIERFLLQVTDTKNTLDPGFLRTLEIEDANLKIARVNQSQWMHYFSDTNAMNANKKPSVILVDQDGFAMMIYNNTHTGNDLLTDLTRLLKYSYE